MRARRALAIWILTCAADIGAALNNWLDDNGRYRLFDRNTATKFVVTLRF
jgi:hypothetical protein